MWWGHRGTLWPLSRGVGEISRLLEVIMQSNVLTFMLPANGGMEGDCWGFFLVFQSASRLSDSTSNHSTFHSSRR